MIYDHFSSNGLFYWEDPGLSLRNIGFIKQLKGFVAVIENEIKELEKEPTLNAELIIREKAILEATRKELRRIERQNLYLELDL